MKLFLIGLFSAISPGLMGQQPGLEFKPVSVADLAMVSYSLDTTAEAVVLCEFGNAWVDTNQTYNLMVEYRVRIKILKPGGLDRANVEISLQKNKGKFEKVNSVTASSFNLLNTGLIGESVMAPSAVFHAEDGEFRNSTKFTIPNVKVGSVIEYKYQLQSPFLFNFYPWKFQSDIPKISSEYWARIPGNYLYNISLKGPHKLTRNENSIESKCVVVSEAGYGGGTYADCLSLKFGMQDVPAFNEEEFMTAKVNFLSAVYFELSEVRHFSGHVDKITKDWKSADQELKLHKMFGVQLKKGKIPSDKFKLVVGVDSLRGAREIYDFIKFHYRWNEIYGFLSRDGINEAFENKKGNVADINLSLVAVLGDAGFQVDPVILSTRRNGLPKQIFPVLSDFNYVVARLNLGGKIYLLDATDPFLPFGMLPFRCLNAFGRVIAETGSYWMDIKPVEKSKRITTYQLTLHEDGLIDGVVEHVYQGYEALDRRKKMAGITDPSEYSVEIEKELTRISVDSVTIDNRYDLEKNYMERFNIAFTDFQTGSPPFLLNPFMFNRMSKNPLKSESRLYPVDYGMPQEKTIIFSLELAPSFRISELPERVGVSLPSGGGRYLCSFTQLGNRLMVNSTFVLARPLYSSEEYHYLRELYALVIQSQNIDLILQRQPPTK